MGALSDFQTALYLALTSDSTLEGLLGGPGHIGDWIDPKGPFPWVTIGDDKEKQWHTKSESNYRTAAVIHVWTRPKYKRGWKQANQIVDRLDVLLLDNQLQLAGTSRFTIIGKGQRPDDTVKLHDEDGKTRHAVVSYNFWLSC